MSMAVGATRMGRRHADALIVGSGSVGVVKRKTGVAPGVAPGYEETPIYTVVYSGPGKVRQSDRNPSRGSVPGSVVVDQRAVLSLPLVGSEGVRTDDIWEWTANPLDVSKVGVRLRIDGVEAGTFVTARRFPVVEVS